MSTFKKIVAVFLAVLLIAATGAVAASAYSVNTLEITHNKAGFEFTIYRIAELDKTDGSYTYPAGVDASVQNVVKKIQQPTPTKTAGKVFRDELDAIYNGENGASKFGTALGTVTSTEDFTATKEGIYYGVVTAWPATKTDVNNVVIVWPEYDATSKTWNYMTDGNKAYTVDIARKVSSGNDSFDKYFSEDFGKEEKAVYQFSGQNVGEEVHFTLEANIVGSATQNLQSFTFKDDMSAGLDYVAGSMHVYYGTKDAIDESKNIDSLFSGLEAQTKDASGTHFTISATSAALASADFYNHKMVYVKYTAKINNNAVVGTPGNPNTGKLEYTNVSGDKQELGPVTRIVWTYNIEGLKTNGSTNQPLKGAKFALATDNAFESVIAEGTSNDSGEVKFFAKDSTGSSNPYRFAPGTYYVKETDVPSGFALSTVVYTVVVSDDLTVYSDAKSIVKVNNGEAIKNYPVKLPETGGNGTMMFTIIGGVLVILAGAMFVIIMKKRSSSK